MKQLLPAALVALLLLLPGCGQKQEDMEVSRPAESGLADGVSEDAPSPVLIADTPDFFSDIGKTPGEVMKKYPEGRFFADLTGFPDSAAGCFGEEDAEYAYFFFGGQSGDFEKAWNECQDRLKCAGFVAAAGVLFPGMKDELSFEEFFSLLGVDTYVFFSAEETPVGEGWLKFTYNGMEVMVNTNEIDESGRRHFTGAEIVRRDAPASIVDTALLKANLDIVDPVMFDQTMP